MSSDQHIFPSTAERRNGEMPRKHCKERYGDILKSYDQFETRMNLADGRLYYYNPYTGETVQPDDGGYINRTISLWTKAEKPSKFVDFTTLLPEYYAARMWGRRKIPKFTEETAALHLTAVARGFLARLALREYYKYRYLRVFDESSGYFYFQDQYAATTTVVVTEGGEEVSVASEPSWHKPRLAFPNDIEIYEPFADDPKDFMKGKNNKYTYREFISGPYVRRELGTYGRKRTVRAENYHFLEINPLKYDAITSLHEVDLLATPLDSVIHIFDGMKPKEAIISDYVLMRTIVSYLLDNNCDTILSYMEQYASRPLVVAYGLYNLSKMMIPCDEFGSLEYSAKRSMDLCFDFILDPHRNIIYPHKVFALQALYNILYTSPGRAEFFDTTSDPPSNSNGDMFDGPLGKRILLRVKTLSRFVENIPMDTMVLKEKDEWGRMTKESKTVTPTDYGVSAAEYALMIIGFLAWNQDMRESVGETCMESVMYCMQSCIGEAGILIAGFRALYNFIYRCEVNHQLLNSLPIEVIIDKARYNFSGDPTVTTQLKRLEVALRPDGWRGNVEIDMQLEEEMLTRRMTSRDPGDDISILGFADASVSAEQKRNQLRENSFKTSSKHETVSVLDFSMITGDNGSVAESK